MPAAPYLITTTRLGLRTWTEDDIDLFAAINADPEVMRFFPRALTRSEVMDFIRRMQQQYAEHGFCYFALERLDNGRLIGFTGLLKQTYEAPFTPYVDIGWRLARAEWGKGYATEAAQACMAFAFDVLTIEKVCSVATLANTASINVMEKIGMRKAGTFIHPRLADDERLRNCVWYERKRPLLL